MFGRQKTRRTRTSVTSRMLRTSTSSNDAQKSTVTTITWQTMVDCSVHGQQQPGKRDPRSCCNESLEQRPPLMSWNADSASWWRQLCGWCCRRGTQVLCRWETGRWGTKAWKWFVPESKASGVHWVVVSHVIIATIFHEQRRIYKKVQVLTF